MLQISTEQDLVRKKSLSGIAVRTTIFVAMEQTLTLVIEIPPVMIGYHNKACQVISAPYLVLIPILQRILTCTRRILPRPRLTGRG